MKIETFKCDVCGKQKGAMNHWFKLDTVNGDRINICTFSGTLDDKHMLHLCGEACVLQKVSEFMGKLRNA